jgi:ketosteroid isomerase-like protein
MTDPTDTARQFVARINQRDVAGLIQLMTSDHRLIDPGGLAVTGHERLQAAWRAYFQMIPDYWVAVEQTLTEGNTVVLLGRAGGTHAPDGQLSPARRWQVPAAWRAVVQGGAVAEWQVYADNEPLRVLKLGEREPGSGTGGV